MPKPLPQAAPPEQPPKKRRAGCWLTGCLVLLLLALLVALGLYFLFRRVADNVSPQARNLAPQELPQAGKSSLEATLAELPQALASGRQVRLVLDAEQMNHLIATRADLAALRGHLRCRDFRDGKALLELSLPLDALGFPGHYINGDATLELTHDGKLLHVFLRDFEDRGHRFPDFILNRLRDRDLVEVLASQSPANREQLESTFAYIRGVDLAGGHLLLDLRQPAAGDSR